VRLVLYSLETLNFKEREDVKGPLKEQIQESNDDPSPYFCTVLTVCNHWVPVLISAAGIVR
jgi:hypothetical protein